MKKILSLALATVMALSLVSCKSNNGGNTVSTAGGADAKYPASDKPITLTIFGYDGKPFDNEYPVFKKAAEFTNVSLEGVIPKSMSDEAQAFSTMVSSGDLADIICHYKDEINKYALEGMYEPLNDLIDEHAPNIKKFLEENEDVRKYITAPDGQIYCIPFVPAGDTAKAWFVRKDWLDKLGLNTPTNLDEFYNMLVAFRDGDPNGNGQADEVPYFDSGRADNLLDMVSLWGAHSTWYVKDGTVHYGPIEEEFKTAMVNMAKWYKEGLIDEEVYLRDSNARELFLGDNIGGVTHNWVGSTAQYNDMYQKTNPEFEFVVIAPPTGVEPSRRERLRQESWAMSSTNKDKVATIKFFDFFFTEEGRRLVNFGVEGVHYDMVDGKPVFKPEILNGEKTVLEQLKDAGAQTKMGYEQDFEYERQWLNKYASEGMDLYTQNNYMEEIPVFLRDADDDKRYANLITAIRTYQEETFQKWILGVEAVEPNWDKFVAEMKRLNIEEMISIQQKAYETFMNN